MAQFEEIYLKRIPVWLYNLGPYKNQGCGGFRF